MFENVCHSGKGFEDNVLKLLVRVNFLVAEVSFDGGFQVKFVGLMEVHTNLVDKRQVSKKGCESTSSG